MVYPTTATRRFAIMAETESWSPAELLMTIKKKNSKHSTNSFKGLEWMNICPVCLSKSDWKNLFLVIACTVSPDIFSPKGKIRIIYESVSVTSFIFVVCLFEKSYRFSM